MKNIIYILIILLILIYFSFPVFSQINDQKAKAFYYIENRGEVYIRFIPPFFGKKTGFLDHLSIDKITNDTIYAYANLNGFNLFLTFNIPFETLIPPSLFNYKCMGIKEKNQQKWNFYPTYQEYINIMEAFTKKFPDICTLDTIGYSIKNRKILFLKISDHVHIRENEPEYMYTSTMHGDEASGYVILLRFIDYILNNYEKDLKITYLINHLQIWINPLANPDGTYFGGDSTVYGSKRFNHINIDLNRNFPDPEEGKYPDGFARQPENMAMMDFMEKHRFVLSGNIFSGVELINYPWDTWSRAHADDDWYSYIVHQYVDTAHKYSPDGYMQYQDQGLTQGIEWYRVKGGRQDYVNYFIQGREVDIEISEHKIPLPINLDKIWKYNYRSLINYMKQALYGIRGKVTDSLTGEPLMAKIFILDHDRDSSWVFSDGVTGMYQRLIYEGNYSIMATANGYYPKKIPNVNILNQDSLRLDIKLVKMQYFYEDRLYLGLYPNPFGKNTKLMLSLPEATHAYINLYDSYGRMVYTILDRELSKGINEIRWNASHIADGVYILNLITDYANIVVKAVKDNDKVSSH